MCLLCVHSWLYILTFHGYQMAGMQEQIRQLEDVNEDMMEDAERYAALRSV